MNIAFSFGGEDTMSDVLPRKRTVPLLASRRSPKLFAVPLSITQRMGMKRMMFRRSRRSASVYEVTSFREDKGHRHSLLPPFPASQGGLDSFCLL